ncbi:Neuronal-specific septin-3 [Lobosporangium transversale]|nr:Neuronal-specific septin-3 [Lobosporangium transversale]
MPLEFAHQHNGQFPDVGPWRHPEARPLQLSAPLGLETLPGQRFTKVKRKAFDLNLMVVGESGLGKTTFMNTLFNSNLKEEIPVKKIHSSQTVEITPSYYDTPGFGDELNRERNLAPIIEYIDRQYEEYMAAERHPGFRKTIPDTRIHAVLYFLAPTGHGLKELDVRALKNLSEKANVIPLIAKGDTMTAEEKVAFKSLLLRDLEEYQIRTFPSSYPDEVDDAEELLNPEHSDFVHLRELLLATCLHDLVECTHGTHYHAFRAKALRSRGRPTSILKCDDSYESQIMDARQRNRQEMERKEEEIRQKFIEKVQEKETALREREEQLNAKKAEMVAELEQYKVLLEKEQRELDELIANSRSNTLSKSTSKLNKAK